MCILHLELAKPIKDARLWLAVLGLLALVAAPLLMRNFHKTESSARFGSRTQTPEEILLECYSRGEVDRTQFILMLDDLRTQNPRKSR